MAVRHGYGKIAGADALVFAYDTGDTINSYKGEPTSNRLLNNIWGGDGGNQTFATKGATVVTNNAFKYKGLDTVLWTPGLSYNCYLHTSVNLNSSDTSTIWTFSCYIKREDGGTLRTSDNNLSVYLYYPNSDGAATGTIQDLGDGWYRVFRTRTGADSHISLAGFTGFAPGYKYYLSGCQLEKLNHPTPSVAANTTRSATQGLLDLTGKGTINLTNTSFNANAQPFFDGVDDRIVVPYSGTDLNGDPLFTVEGIFKRTGASMSTRGFWGLGGDISEEGICGYTYGGSGNNIAIDLWGRKTYRTGVDYPLNQYVHVVWVKSAPTFTVNTVAIYINGVEYTGASFIVNRDNAATVNLNTGNVGRGISIGRIGPQTNTYYGVGEIPVFKVYNKALTVDEINNNYNHYKTRFNL
jgi:hypothetical protein